jgi:hypothetical protein
MTCIKMTRALFTLIFVVLLLNTKPVFGTPTTPTPDSGTDSEKFGSNQWAQFCNDDNCSEDCGIWVDMYNPGCLTEHGRRSVHIRAGGEEAGSFNVIYSPDDQCTCQNHCDDVTSFAQGGCYIIANDTTASSFRFISQQGQGCHANQC